MKRKSNNGQSRIAAAVIRSLWIFAGLALLLGLTLWFLTRTPNEPDIPEAKVTVPTSQAHSQQPPDVQFTDITTDAGIDFVHVNGAYGKRLMPEAMGSGAAFFDYDNDGDQDIFLVNSRYWSGYEQQPAPVSALYENKGHGQFKDISKQAGIQISKDSSGGPAGKALGVMPVDYDRDGWVDLIVANDTVSNFLFHNQAGKVFEEVSAFEGIAYDRSGKATGAMGIDAAWLRNDEDLGVAIGNFGNEMSSLFMTAQGHPPFADEALLTGIGPASRLALTFGLFFFFRSRWPT